MLIADDEPIARLVLRELLEDFPQVKIIGEASTGTEAAEQLRQLEPELICLDLQMPGMDGFAVARSLKGGKLPLIIFVTAYDRHAHEAFDTGAVDYLLKPVRRERLGTALEKARAQFAGVTGVHGSPVPPPPRKIVGRLGPDMHVLDPSDVIALQAGDETVEIITAGQRYLADYPLRELEQRLRGGHFRRIHRKTIINTDHIRQISPLSSKRWLLHMSNGMQVIVSKRMAGAIREDTHW
ncbi:MAG: LytTR family DNA-binding domain-containing protein [Acidobacteria bacterium]|nr:LytTR family DNA-binding domain-containing protein [Acidobacteriota bacterium]